ncbi:MAG: Co2+/Mg2+ efflux protein ApaG [Ectothiorhodospiraceae bacterium]|nr:Co2+/Mg2+ efflux protein ApaG [Ectothiorhodospiraceae bacterium]
MLTYIETTADITVSVQPLFLEERSNVMKKEFIFVYFIKVRNDGSVPVKLTRRHWDITDSNGEFHEVDGEGVVGQQPTIAPGKEYAYNSFCVLKSFSGHMEGTYTMEQEDGTAFEITIPRFHLRAFSN